jgi:penicillin-binding protein 2
VVIAVVFTFRLAWLQIIDDSYKASASNNSRRDVTIYPSRGLIYDRNGELLVYNEAVYDLMVIPNQTNLEDTTAFCQLIGINKENFRKKMKEVREYSLYKKSIFEKQISKETAGYIKERLYKDPGFYLRTRTLRSYPYPIAAHLLGHIGEVSPAEIKKDNYYKAGDYIGKSGLEKKYEKVLRGKKGVKKLLVDVHNREMGKYMNGRYDSSAVAGKDLTSTLDIPLQRYGERLMEGKTGSVVAIEPSTGEILCLISSPGYDPNLLVGRIRNKNYTKLQQDSTKPLFNRALMAPYPPGSIFKIVQALIGLHHDVIDSTTGFPCNKSLVGCHNHPNASNVRKGIKYSCNPYFYKVFQRIILQGDEESVFKNSREGLKKWREDVLKFGMGKSIGLDLQNVKSGYVPTIGFYDRWYGKNRWAFSTIYSLSIGQGEVEVIPIQMANLAAIIANRGYYIEPHLVRAIEEEPLDRKALEPKETGIRKPYFELAADAMYGVVNEPYGTARRARMDSIDVCGKTGTSENPHGEDHSAFIAFAPKDNPKIAISVYVENAGFGGTWAAPIASLMIEKFLTDTIQNTYRENRILNTKITKDGPQTQ